MTETDMAIHDSEQLYKRTLMYNLKEMNKAQDMLSYIRNILYILIGILIIFLLYNLIVSKQSFIKNLIV